MCPAQDPPAATPWRVAFGSRGCHLGRNNCILNCCRLQLSKMVKTKLRYSRGVANAKVNGPDLRCILLSAC